MAHGSLSRLDGAWHAREHELQEAAGIDGVNVEPGWAR